MKWRLTALIIIFGILYIFLIFNIYNLQIRNGIIYQIKAGVQERASGVLEATRGNIYFSDRNNNLIPAALNKEYPVIFAVPEEIKDAKSVALSLSEIINKPADDSEKILSKPNDLYELLVQKATPEEVEKVKNLK